jgi:MoxR-like ATPase
MTTPAATTTARAAAVLDEIERVVVGKRAALTLILTTVLASGHVLIEDLPGLGKTLIARSFAAALGLDFTRVQFTPDLLPADLLGSTVYDMQSGRFEFRAGPIFTNLLLADEINRTPPKTQAALLEAMAERQVSIDGETHGLPQPFIVLATDNPMAPTRYRRRSWTGSRYGSNFATSPSATRPRCCGVAWIAAPASR